jgi:drug/metabolite transporter (DMT)-like permease
VKPAAEAGPAAPAAAAPQAVAGSATEPAGQPARWAWVLLWVVPALWSSNYVIARLALGVVGPHALASGRWLIALALMLPFVGWTLWRRRAVVAQEWRQMLVLGALGMALCGAWVYVGAASTTAVNIALIYAVTPVAIAVASVKLLHERMHLAQRVAVVAALAGVLFIIARGSLDNLLAVRFAAGDGWVLACAVAWTAYSVLLRRWPSALDPAPRLAAIIAGGLLVLAPFTLAEALWWQPPPLSLPALGLMVAGGVLPGVLSYTAYSYLQRELGVSRSALLLYVAPVYGALLAWWLLGETPGWHHAVGAALILPSIWLATRTAPAR